MAMIRYGSPHYRIRTTPLRRAKRNWYFCFGWVWYFKLDGAFVAQPVVFLLTIIEHFDVLDNALMPARRIAVVHSARFETTLPYFHYIEGAGSRDAKASRRTT